MITIIVLLILAGVALATLTGQGNIIGNAENAVGQYNNSVESEQQLLNEMEKYLQNYLDVENGDSGLELEVANVEKPVLMEGMVAVYWSTDGGVTASTTEEGATEIYSKIDSNGKASSTGTDNQNFKWENWYAYTRIVGDDSTDGKFSRWANAITDDGSYWVWIPRYKYKITNQPTETGMNSAGKIDIKFISTTDKQGTEGYTTKANADGEILTTDNEGYIIHPAFENGSSTGKNNEYANGEWDNELPGFWIAKYESGMEDGNGNVLNTFETEGNISVSESVKLVSKPNVNSWIGIQIGQAYQNGLKYDQDKNSHLIKNSEWGAVAYLTHSQYGRNGNEISTNNSEELITGSSAGIPSDDNTWGDNIYKYNEKEGMLASTTGNIYGVYDMSGGATEYSANWNSESGSLDEYGKAIDGTIYFSNSENNDRTKNAYLNGTSNFDGENVKNICRVGDGIKEVWVDESMSWFNDGAIYVNEYNPFSIRGGTYRNSTDAGIFYSVGYNGVPDVVSFRIVLASI